MIIGERLRHRASGPAEAVMASRQLQLGAFDEIMAMLDGRHHLFAAELGELCTDVVHGTTVGEMIHDDADRDAGPRDDRLAVADPGIDLDELIHTHSVFGKPGGIKPCRRVMLARRFFMGAPQIPGRPYRKCTSACPQQCRPVDFR